MANLKTDKKCDILVRIEQDGDVAYYRAKDGIVHLEWGYDRGDGPSLDPRTKEATFVFDGMEKLDAVIVTETTSLVEQVFQKSDKIEALEWQLLNLKRDYMEVMRENDRIIEKLRYLADGLSGDAE